METVELQMFICSVSRKEMSLSGRLGFSEHVQRAGGTGNPKLLALRAQKSRKALYKNQSIYRVFKPVLAVC